MSRGITYVNHKQECSCNIDTLLQIMDLSE